MHSSCSRDICSTRYLAMTYKLMLPYPKLPAYLGLVSLKQAELPPRGRSMHPLSVHPPSAHLPSVRLLSLR